jgi:AraC-like DNA-binding protein
MQKWRLKYLATWRLDLAADYLRAGEMTIRQIAETTGYGSESALTRAFKVQHGITPAKFRTLSTTVHPKN